MSNIKQELINLINCHKNNIKLGYSDKDVDNIKNLIKNLYEDDSLEDFLENNRLDIFKSIKFIGIQDLYTELCELDTIKYENL